MTTHESIVSLQERVRKLSLWGLLAHWDEVEQKTWLPDLIAWEEEERKVRSLQSRLQSSRIGRFKPMSDYDWKWPEKIDCNLIEELFTLRFIEEKANVVLLGPNGVGKTMIAQNLAYQALLRGHTVIFTTASKMLNDLIAQETASALNRKLHRYCRPALLVIDEVGYLSYDNRHTDLLFEVVTRRYNEKSLIVTTNRAFKEWNKVFPSSACVVTLIDRLIHHSEIVEIKADSYRFKEAKERALQKSKNRQSKKIQKTKSEVSEKQTEGVIP